VGTMDTLRVLIFCACAWLLVEADAPAQALIALAKLGGVCIDWACGITRFTPERRLVRGPVGAVSEATLIVSVPPVASIVPPLV
jgi:hypothetical protein